MIKKIDSLILAVCTRFSHWLQRITGLTNYFVAKIGVGCTAIAVIVEIANFAHQIFRYPTPLILLVFDTAILLNCIYRSLVCTKAQDQFYESANTKPAELMIYSSIGEIWRLLWVIFSLQDAAHLFLAAHTERLWFLRKASDLLFSLGLAIFYYFIAVDPLPPGKSKVRQWIESFQETREALPVPAKS